MHLCVISLKLPGGRRASTFMGRQEKFSSLESIHLDLCGRVALLARALRLVGSSLAEERGFIYLKREESMDLSPPVLKSTVHL